MKLFQANLIGSSELAYVSFDFFNLADFTKFLIPK